MSGSPSSDPSSSSLIAQTTMTIGQDSSRIEYSNIGETSTSSEVSGKRVGGKPNVASACAPCKKAHLGCDVTRPCKRCINMGKEDQCLDVPHKKRGRPKVNKQISGGPYQRVKPPPAVNPIQTSSSVVPSTAESSGSTRAEHFPRSSSENRWKNSPYDNSPYPPDAPPNLGGPSSGIGNIPPTAPIHPPSPEFPTLFTLFTTTDFRILRVSSGCYPLTGYHAHEFVNLSFFDWLHPSDRHIMESEKNRLITPPPGLPAGKIMFSDRETQSVLTNPQRSDRELMLPAEGMREPYPNQNVRIIRSDSQFSYYNVRLHLGGALGASVWRGDTLSRAYLVVSCLILPPSSQPTPVASTLPVPSYNPGSIPLDPALRDRRPHSVSASGYGPPTPSTPGGQGHGPGVNPAQSLPSFSSIAAAADAPSMPAQRYEPSPVSATAYQPSASRPDQPPYYPAPYPHPGSYVPGRPPNPAYYTNISNNDPNSEPSTTRSMDPTVERRTPPPSSQSYRPPQAPFPISIPQTATSAGLPTPIPTSSHYPYPQYFTEPPLPSPRGDYYVGTGSTTGPPDVIKQEHPEGWRHLGGHGLQGTESNATPHDVSQRPDLSSTQSKPHQHEDSPVLIHTQNPHSASTTPTVTHPGPTVSGLGGRSGGQGSSPNDYSRRPWES